MAAAALRPWSFFASPPHNEQASLKFIYFHMVRNVLCDIHTLWSHACWGAYKDYHDRLVSQLTVSAAEQSAGQPPLALAFQRLHLSCRTRMRDGVRS